MIVNSLLPFIFVTEATLVGVRLASILWNGFEVKHFDYETLLFSQGWPDPSSLICRSSILLLTRAVKHGCCKCGTRPVDWWWQSSSSCVHCVATRSVWQLKRKWNQFNIPWLFWNGLVIRKYNYIHYTYPLSQTVADIYFLLSVSILMSLIRVRFHWNWSFV